MRSMRPKQPRAGFTLVEILIVLTIILLVTVIAAPAIYTALNGRQVTDAARVFTGALAGIRDAAIRANEPRGLRLLPDPTRTIPPPGDPNAGTIQLVFNRMVQIEPAGDYQEGKVTIGPMPVVTTTWPPKYPRQSIVNGTQPWPFPDPATGNPKVLMIEESVFQGGYVRPVLNTIDIPNPPTNWYWNIRLGEKIKLNGTGRAYTVVGPCLINPWDPKNLGNPDLFVNVGLPGTASPLGRTIYDGTGNIVNASNPEFLFVVNGEDDDGDGWVDPGWDGYNHNFADTTVSVQARNATDEVEEWETEQWTGAAGQTTLTDPLATAANSPSSAWATQHVSLPTIDASYTIQRRAVPSQGTFETALPAGVVIDATTFNTTQERSRYLPITNGTLVCDIMVNPNGQLVPTSLYSTATSAASTPFMHFWLTDATDVYPRGAVWGTTGSTPNTPPAGAPYELPMPSEVLSSTFTVRNDLYPPSSTAVMVPTPILKGDRRLVTLFTKNGVIVTNTIETIEPTSANVPGEGFKIDDVGYPFLKAQLGQREAR